MNTHEAHSLEDELQALSAYLTSLDDEPNAALTQLAGKPDPESVAWRLDILLNNKRAPEAASLVHTMTPHERWCEKAVFALASNGEAAEAKRFLAWSKTQTDLGLIRRCALAYAQGILGSIEEAHRSIMGLCPALLADGERNIVRELPAVLGPIIGIVKANERVENALELHAVTVALIVAHLLRERQESERLALLLKTVHPVPLIVAQVMLQGGLDPDHGLPQRLRDDYPHSFSRQLLAALIEGRVLHDYDGAFQSASDLKELAKSTDEKEDLFKALVEISQELGPDAENKTDALVPEILDEGSRLRKLHQAGRLLREGVPEEAEGLLAETRDEDDPLWLQCEARLQYRKGSVGTAAEYLSKAWKCIPASSDLPKQAAIVAFEARRNDLAEEALAHLLRMNPDDVWAHHKAAFNAIEEGTFSEATVHFAELRRLDPDDSSHAINQAICLARSGELEQSLGILAELCALNDPPSEAVRLRAQLLQTKGSPCQGFTLLQPFRDRHWDDPGFLQVYSELAWASGDDKAGMEAIFHLKQLQDAGQIESKIIQEKSLDDILGLMMEERQHKQELYEHILGGRMSWLFADSLLGNCSYVAWRSRTQPLPWNSEYPQHRAAQTVYSSHGFHVAVSSKETSLLEELRCAPRGTDVVADISALITLHQLGLLEIATTYFGRVFVPEAYFSLALEEQGKLVPHQPSKDRFYVRVRNAVDSEEIRIFDGPSENVSCYIDAYGEAEQGCAPTHCLADMVDVLHRSGKIDDAIFHEFQRLPNVSEIEAANRPELKMGQDMTVAVSSLGTLHAMDVLDAALAGFRISVTPNQADRVRASVAACEEMAETRRWHVDLWKLVRENTGFTSIPAPHLEEEQGRRDERDTPIVSALLAEEKGLPLFADDRLLQTLAARRSLKVAFGTDTFLWALYENKTLDARALTDAFVQLMDWRYRFLVPPVVVLKSCADRYKAYPPGRKLMEVARYMHDCLQDPGLLMGMEQTTPPMSMAGRLFQAWAVLAGRFVMAIWSDSTYDETVATALTEWAVQELLPSSPRRMGPLGFHVASKCRGLFMVRAMTESCHCEDLSRVTQCFRAIRKAFGISDVEYVDMVAEILTNV